MSQNTLYIAEPIFSENLQRFDSEASFPPIKKIGITTNLPDRREKELMGTISPVKIAIVKAWTGIDARKVELMLHTILDNTRLDGEYFWDGNETLVDAVSGFIQAYHPEARLIPILVDSDVVAATKAIQKKDSQRVHTDIIPKLDQLSIKYHLKKNGNGVTFKLGDYNLSLSGRTGGKYTLTISSRTKTTEEALVDFSGSQELSANFNGESNRCARIPMSPLETIMQSINSFVKKSSCVG